MASEIEVSEAARLLRCTPENVRKLHHKGILPGRRVERDGKRIYLLSRRAVEARAHARAVSP